MDSSENKDWIFTALKNMGVKIPKIKLLKSLMPKQDEDPPHSDSKLFGISLFKQECTYEFNYGIPKFLAVATAYLSNFSTSVGLFRKSGSIIRQKSLRIKLKNGENLDGSNPNDVASLLKQWLRELPVPLIPHCLHELFIRCRQLCGEDCTSASLLSCLLLPPEHLYPLKHLMCFLKTLAMHSNENKMGKDNLALMLAPNIFTSKTGSVNKNWCSGCLVLLHASVIELLIENADHIGEIPLNVSLHHPIHDERRGSNFDSPSETLDSGPSKFSRKLKVGNVQDVFSGIRKFGQNTALNLKSSTPAKFWSSQKLPSRPMQLKNTGGNCPAPPNNETMQNNGIGPKSNCCHKKSSGFLRLKDRKGTSSQTKRTTQISKLNSADKQDLIFKVPVSSNENEKKSPLEQLDELKCESLAMCHTKCNLAAVTKEPLKCHRLSQSNIKVKHEQLEIRKSKSLDTNAESNINQNQAVTELESLFIKQKYYANDVTKGTIPQTLVTMPKNNKNTLKMQSKKNSYRIYNENRVDVQRSKSVDSKWRSGGNGSVKTSKTVRQHSLIRGKPNTTKNGLPFQNLNKLCATQSLNTEKTTYQGDNTILFETKPALDDPEMNPSPLSVDNIQDINADYFANSDSKNSQPQNREASYPIKLNKELPVQFPKTVYHSNSMIPRLKYFLGENAELLSETSADGKPQTPKLRSSINSRIPVLLSRKPTSPDLVNSFDDGCFQTPNQTWNSLDSTSWMSCYSFLSINTPQNSCNKRKSIALILKNNSGFVLEKVRQYDSRSGKSSASSTNASNNSYKVFSLDMTPISHSQNRLSNKLKNRSPKRINVKNRIVTPSKLPQRPSKFAINLEALSKNTNHPLKEVTNVDAKQIQSHNIPPVKALNLSRKSVFTNKQNCFNTDLRKAKRKRNSFSGYSPKFSKRVPRSESLRSCLAV